MEYQHILIKITDLQKKVEEIRPLDKQQVAELRNYYKIGLTWSSNALEGNSLTKPLKPLKPSKPLRISADPEYKNRRTLPDIPNRMAGCGFKIFSPPGHRQGLFLSLP